MVQVHFHKSFDKMFKKCSASVIKRFRERMAIFLEDQFAPELNSHALHGTYEGLRSINITGDIRAVYDPVSSQIVRFVAIGTHSQLHG